MLCMILKLSAIVLLCVYLYLKFIYKNPTNIINIVRRMFGLIDPRTCAATYRVDRVYNKKHDAIGVISTSLFGRLNDAAIYKKYVVPMFESIKETSIHLPGWAYRVYTDPGCPSDIINQMVSNGAEVYVMNQESVGTEGSMWRFLPAAEPLPFICVDSDDRIYKHIPMGMVWTDYINSWLKSDSIFFQHTLYILPIQAKFWGGKGRCIPNINTLINKYCRSWYGNDEAFLTKVVLPMFRKYGVCHPVHDLIYSIAVFCIFALFIFLYIK